MSEEKKHIVYSSEDIYKYLSGQLPPAQMHAMEKAALSDPLLADAIDGYDELPDFKNENGFSKIQSDLAELRQKIDGTTVVPITKYKNRWWQIAAAAVIITGVFALYKFSSTEPKDNNIIIAKNETKISAETSTQPIFKVDTSANNVAANNVIIKSQNGTTSVENNYSITPSTVSGNEAIAATKDTSVNFNQSAQEYQRDVAIREKAVKKDARTNGMDKYFDAEINSNVQTNSRRFFSGRIVDENANAVPYANIVINNMQESKTDANGMFNITLSDTVAQLTAVAKNYRATTTNINAASYNTITLSPKKIILKRDKEFSKDLSKAKQLHRSIVTVLTKNNAEPKEGWLQFEQKLINLLSGSEYDDGKPVFGEMIVSFDVNANFMPANFTFEKSINSDVDEAVESLIKNESEWKAVDNRSLPGTVKLKIIF